MKTEEIIRRIHEDFGKTYKAASAFVDSGELWEFCLNVLADPTYMSCIVFANDMEVPPVKSLLLIYRRVMHPAEDFVFPEQDRKNMGALMGFVFKHVLGYTDQRERCTVHDLGVKTATRFLGGQVYYFE